MPPPPTPSLSATAALARELIRRESVTPDDAGCQALILARLEAVGFVGEWMNFEGVTNLWATRRGEDKEGRPLLVFAGHTDVVPPGPVGEWRMPPFAGEVEGGMLHGRGAVDMKGAIACFVTACERFVAGHQRHNGAIGFLLTSDEEGPARWGTREVMRVLSEREDGPCMDMCIVGEPTSSDALGDVIKVGRRGSLSAVLRMRGVQQHIAYATDNPIHAAAEVIAELSALEWDRGNDDFPPTSFQVSAIRADAGAANVVPGEVEVAFNLRYSPEITEDAIKARVDQTLARCGLQCEIEWTLSGRPFATAPGRLIQAVSGCVEAVTGRAPARSTSGGTSDGRFIAPAGVEVVELGLVNATIHQIDERVSIADLDQLSDIYEKILQEILG